MNPRERILATVVVSLVVLIGGAFLFNLFYLDPASKRAKTIKALRNEVLDKETRLTEMLADHARLEQWRQLSLPTDTDLARREYEKYLSDVLRQSGFASGAFQITPKAADTRSSPTIPAKKEPIYTRLTFTVSARGDLGSFTESLQRFYRTPLLHQVKNLSIQRPVTTEKPRELVINMTIEALIVTGAEKRPQLMPAADRRLAALDLMIALTGNSAGIGAVIAAVSPTGPAGPRVLARAPLHYAAIGDHNIFHGPPPPSPPPPLPEKPPADDIDVAEFIYLTDITRSERGIEGFLYDRITNRQTRLRNSAAFDSFKVLDTRGETILRGFVVRFDERDLIFRVEDETWNKMVKDKVVREDSASHTWKMDRQSWETLKEDEVILVSNRGRSFQVGRLQGDVVKTDKDEVVLRIYPYCSVHIGDHLSGALRKPLKDEQLKELGVAQK